MTVKQTVEIKNKLGMHARPAMKLFELVQSFDAEVMLRNERTPPRAGISKSKRPAPTKSTHWRRSSSCSTPGLMKISR